MERGWYESLKRVGGRNGLDVQILYDEICEIEMNREDNGGFIRKLWV